MYENDILPGLQLDDYERLNLEETGTAVIIRNCAIPYGQEWQIGSMWVNAVSIGSYRSEYGIVTILRAVRSGNK